MANTGRSTPGYAGLAGQLAVGAQFASLGYNVAIPGYDVGYDAIVLNDSTGDSWRIQAKFSAEQRRSQVSSVFWVRVKKDAITTHTPGPPLYFVFVLAKKNGWRYLTFSQCELRKYLDAGAGTPDENPAFIKFQITLKDEPCDKQVTCSFQNWTRHLDNWEVWPNLRKPD